jgi:hypothetical protein
MTILFSALIALIGLVMYFVCTNPKLIEVGRIMFWTGLLAFMLGGGIGAIHVLPGPK